ncbi:caspase family protein [Burkholderia gladioli]|uniref:caspase family protein n=1 Tax=Burkholderia gladioli TaxID=28095 RepID=UPI002FE429A1
MRKALVVGIDYYEHIGSLKGCVNDAYGVKTMLERDADGSPNFGMKLMTASSDRDAISRRQLKDAVQELFRSDDEIALLYFAGHGHVESTGGYICGSDAQEGDEGLALPEIIAMATNCRAQHKIIILDSCHSGSIGDDTLNPAVAEIADGMTILTASSRDQYANEENGGGIFTNLLIDALSGAAADLMGRITPGSVYAHIDQSLGTWSQRPVFKTNVKSFVSLRRVDPPIDRAILRRLPEFFPEAEATYQLDPAFEPEQPSPGPNPNADSQKTAVFALLQKMNRVGLLVPTQAPHMYYAAIESDSVRLTALGEHYRRLASRGLI